MLGGSLIAALAFSSCSNFMHDELPACNPDYRLRLSYVKNMAYSERVDQVEAAEVYAFDDEGNLKFFTVSDRAALEANDWTVSLKEAKRLTNYNIVVWGGLTSESPFSLDGSRSFNSSGDITCRLIPEIDEEGNSVNTKTFPGLFHGTTRVSYSDYENPEEYKVELTKNTNVLDVTLRRDDNFNIGPQEFIVKVTDNNGVMSSTNEVSGDATIHYMSQTPQSGEYNKPDGQGGYLDETTLGALAEVHLARLMPDSQARLIVIQAEGNNEIFNEKLIDMLMEAKKYTYPDMDVQEYLDRMDHFTVDISMDIKDYFANLSIYVAGWAVMNYEVEWK
ncbi:MAG: FimB/Mfa2 family fimbrial subunit [Muribaculaceae bacterium]|nr:FimB/Mfa2 family fimbrial subunit [Muribaculaceae bacterium]